jgi:hypothetical protein
MWRGRNVVVAPCEKASSCQENLVEHDGAIVRGRESFAEENHKRERQHDQEGNIGVEPPREHQEYTLKALL